MRILHSSRTTQRLTGSVRLGRVRLRSVIARGLSWAGLILAISAAGAIWYRFEGQGLVDPWLRNRILPGRNARDALPTLHIEIGSREVERLAAQREDALRRGILRREEVDRVAARILFRDQAHPAVVWLPEGSTERWQEQQWTLEVDVQDEAMPLDMGAFSARPVGADPFLNEWLYAQDLRDAGILAPRCSLVNLSLNGDDWGLYVLSDLFTGEWLASQGRDAGVIVRLDDRLLEERRAQLGGVGAQGQALRTDPIASTFDLAAFARVEEESAFGGEDGSHRSEQVDAVLGLLRAFQEGQLEASQVYDPELLGRYIAHANLWGARRGLMWYSARYYYNPSTALLESIGHDALPLTPADASFLDLAQYDDLAVMDAYAREAARISQPDYLESFRRAYAGELARYGAALALDAADLEAIWDQLARRQALLAAHALDPLLPDDGSWNSSTLPILSHLAGVEEQVTVDVRHGYPPGLPPAIGQTPILPIPPSVQEALARHPFLAVGKGPGMLALQAGTWHVQGDLVLPEGFGLETTEPVTLTFDRQAVLFSTGPLLLHGPAEGGIHFVPREDRWAGLIVYQAGPQAASSLTNVEIRAAAGARRDGWATTGGATFYQSPVMLNRCRLVDSLSPDAVHLVRTRFEIVNTEFGNVSGNALAGDEVRGRIERCAFHDILGNGLDVRKSRVDVQDSHLVRIYDKAISASEGSVVQVQNVRVADAGVAIASSDMSQVQVHDLRMSQVWLAGLAAYLRDLAYGPSHIQAERLVSEGNVLLPALAQPESRITIDGAEVESSAFDVEALHWRQEATSEVRVLSYRLGDDIRVLGYKLDPSSAKLGEPVRLVLYWQALGEIEREYTVFVHVLDAGGRLVAQRDSMPRDNTLPTTHWLPGRVIEDSHLLALPQALEPGRYRVAVGLYDWVTGERLPIQRLDGEALPNGILLVEPPIEAG